MTKLYNSRRKKVGLLGLLALLICVGVAIAAWMQTNGSNGTFKSGSLQALTAVADPTGGGGTLLYPNGTADVAIKVSNPNTNPVVLTRWDPSPTGSLSSLALTGACTQAMFDIPAAGAAITPSLTIPGGATNQAVLLKDAIHMSASASIDCAGSTFTTTQPAGSLPWRLTISTP